MRTRFIISLLRQRWAGGIIGWIFAHMSFAIPVHRLRETDSLLAFQHPSPAYPVHILIVPKRAYASLLDLPPQDAAFLTDLVEMVQSLVRELGLEGKGYRLVVNGGEYQDVAQLHFHLISEV
jgi:histidine triad (HIT) family protein